ncbi:MAG: arginase family protein, partial [Kiritimatiellae bacterium]|nr:arginase family protein [Kiritimatiellia bacterium]
MRRILDSLVFITDYALPRWLWQLTECVMSTERQISEGQSERMGPSNFLPQSGLFQPPGNFLGLPTEKSAPDRARAWVLPVPYEATTTYGAGTRDGPAAIIAASRQLEWFEREFGCEPAIQVGVHTMNPLALNHRSPEHMVALVEKAVADILTGTPAPEILVVLGGEHTLSIGVARGLVRAGCANFVTVQIDAHCDLRNEYEGTPYS